MPEPLAAYSKAQLEKGGIRIRTGNGVEKVEAGRLTLANGETMIAGLLIWDTGIRPNPLVDGFDCERGQKGGISTDSTFRVLKRPGVWASGDFVEIPRPDGSGKFFEATAQNATL